jgi:hypothetical protein
MADQSLQSELTRLFQQYLNAAPDQTSGFQTSQFKYWGLNLSGADLMGLP